MLKDYVNLLKLYMKIKCENCGEPAMPSDATCWHCGQPLKNGAAKSVDVVTSADTWRETRNTINVIPYLIITIVVIVAAILIMSMIGRKPLLQMALGATIPNGWKSVSPADNEFFVYLPEGWRFWDGANADQVQEFESRMREDDNLTLGAHPFGAEVEDLEILFLAQEENVPEDQAGLFLVFGKSHTLGELTYVEASNYLNASDYRIRGTRLVEDFDKSNLDILIDTPLDDGTGDSLRCRQSFILGSEEAMLVAVCSPEVRYPAQEYQMLTLLESFQWLAK